MIDGKNTREDAIIHCNGLLSAYLENAQICRVIDISKSKKGILIEVEVCEEIAEIRPYKLFGSDVVSWKTESVVGAPESYASSAIALLEWKNVDFAASFIDDQSYAKSYQIIGDIKKKYNRNKEADDLRTINAYLTHWAFRQMAGEITEKITQGNKVLWKVKVEAYKKEDLPHEIGGAKVEYDKIEPISNNDGEVKKYKGSGMVDSSNLKFLDKGGELWHSLGLPELAEEGPTDLAILEEASTQEIFAELERRGVSPVPVIPKDTTPTVNKFNAVAFDHHAKAFGLSGQNVDACKIEKWFEDHEGEDGDLAFKEQIRDALRFFRGAWKLPIVYREKKADGSENRIRCTLSLTDNNKDGQSIGMDIRESGTKRGLHSKNSYPLLGIGLEKPAEACLG